MSDWLRELERGQADAWRRELYRRAMRESGGDEALSREVVELALTECPRDPDAVNPADWAPLIEALDREIERLRQEPCWYGGVQMSLGDLTDRMRAPGLPPPPALPSSPPPSSPPPAALSTSVPAERPVARVKVVHVRGLRRRYGHPDPAVTRKQLRQAEKKIKALETALTSAGLSLSGQPLPPRVVTNTFVEKYPNADRPLRFLGEERCRQAEAALEEINKRWIDSGRPQVEHEWLENELAARGCPRPGGMLEHHWAFVLRRHAENVGLFNCGGTPLELRRQNEPGVVYVDGHKHKEGYR
jgi:hypothetical protein